MEYQLRKYVFNLNIPFQRSQTQIDLHKYDGEEFGDGHHLLAHNYE